ncbi:MAG: MgtC/SapB family protein [Candidatus Pacebacteria bacterium]|nr:MgtC/SapB family protein [Candidatus Paceibacterota bacterium]HOL90542.1 MgtC/SapB family protein [Candidatus Pacearchaeota archaeon]
MAEIILQLLLATIFGALIGLERELKRKEAGLQTYSLVSLGACLFVIISQKIFEIYGSSLNSSGLSFDPSRIILAIATGVGFIGAGVIIFRERENKIEGITTAAGLWVAAGIGTAIGFNLYFISFVSLLFTFLILIVFGELEKNFFINK